MPSYTTCATAADYFRVLQETITHSQLAAIDAYADSLFDAWREKRRVFVFGNGGSAATASHHVADYVKTASVDGRPRLRAFCLNDNVALLTALGNDISYDETFRWPLEAYAEPGDLCVAISSSGNSPNVVNACRWARANGLTVVAITGFQGGKIGELADIHIHFPADNYGVVEDLQLSAGHIAAQTLQRKIAAA
jgi:D-sedoheptulose 7-phosphate isomerase